MYVCHDIFISIVKICLPVTSFSSCFCTLGQPRTRLIAHTNSSLQNLHLDGEETILQDAFSALNQNRLNGAIFSTGRIPGTRDWSRIGFPALSVTGDFVLPTAINSTRVEVLVPEREYSAGNNERVPLHLLQALAVAGPPWSSRPKEK